MSARITMAIDAEVETNLLDLIERLPPSVRNIVEQSHAALCSMRIGRIESALAKITGMGPDQVGSIAARRIYAFECLMRAAYYTLLADQMEADNR